MQFLTKPNFHYDKGWVLTATGERYACPGVKRVFSKGQAKVNYKASTTARGIDTHAEIEKILLGKPADLAEYQWSFGSYYETIPQDAVHTPEVFAYDAKLNVMCFIDSVLETEDAFVVHDWKTKAKLDLNPFSLASDRQQVCANAYLFAKFYSITKPVIPRLVYIYPATRENLVASYSLTDIASSYRHLCTMSAL